MTRLFYEKMLVESFPELQWIRVCTPAPFTVAVYACDANLDLREQMISRLNLFLSQNGLASCHHIVKHYFELQRDEAFPIGQIPDSVKSAALKGNVTKIGVQDSVKTAFPFIDSDHFEVKENKVVFHLKNNEQWTPYQIRFVEMMLTEILPAGSIAELSSPSSVS